MRKHAFTFAFLLLTAYTFFGGSQSFANRCEGLLDSASSSSISRQAIDRLQGTIPEGWMLPAPGTNEFQNFSSVLSPEMRRELLEVGSWKTSKTEVARVPVPVARLSEKELRAIARPRQHLPLPSVDKSGAAFFPAHVKASATGSVKSETFHVRMMVIKNRGMEKFELPPQLEYLRTFFEKSFELERTRNPKTFKDRYAFVQVDASWVDPGMLQPRPGKTTTQLADPKDRKGAHVDGFLTDRFHDLEEDVTYSLSVGFDPKTSSSGDAIPTEFYDSPFPIPAGLTHPEARVHFDKIANQHEPIYIPSGFINRMSSRTVHRVGVAQRPTYRTFVKVKFTDEAFNQAENTINGNFSNGTESLNSFVPSNIYQSWKNEGVPLVERTTLPTEGLIDPKDAAIFQNRARIGNAP